MIDLGNVTIDGVNESLIRDNVAGVDVDLLDRAIEQLVAPYRSATLGKARTKWTEVAHTETVPAYNDDDAMIDWYVGRDDYKDADAVEAERVEAERQAKIAAIDEQIFDLQGKLAAVQANLDHELTDPESGQVESLQAQVADIETEIAQKEAEKAAL